MEVKIVKENKQPLLYRTSYILKISGNTITPSKVKVADIVSKKLSAEKDLIKISNVYQQYGAPAQTIHAKVYDSKENLEKVEGVEKVEKKEGEEAPKEATPKVEEKKEEAPKEESKE